MNLGGAIIVLMIAIFLALIAIVFIVKNLIYLCGPNEVLVFAGRNAFEPSLRKKVGYRLKRGGRGVRIPLIEKVYRVDLSNMSVSVEIRNAFSKGGIPLNVQGIANLKIASDQPLVGRAIERFMGRERAEIIRAAKETLEGNLRGVLARLTPEQVNEDKNAFAELLVEEADDDLKTLGMTLDTLKIQNVTDDVGYLEAIGRKRSADLQMRASIAESKARAESTIKQAKNMEVETLARIDAEIQVARAEASRRIADAQTRKTAVVAEQRGQVAAEIARSEADISVQQARLEQVRLQLEADVVQPATARKQEMENRAKADAAKIVADGQATVQALQQYVDAWKKGGNAREVVMMQKLQRLSALFAETMNDIEVEHIAVVDSGPNGGLSSDIPKMVVDIMSRLRAAMGDTGLPGNGWMARSPSPTSADPDFGVPDDMRPAGVASPTGGKRPVVRPGATTVPPRKKTE